MTFEEFTSFVLYAPPGTAIFHVLNDGWTADTHQLASIIDVGAMQMWLSTEDAQSNSPKYRPTPVPRPGKTVKVESVPDMTVDDYLRLIQGGGDDNESPS